ncbi:hypothetical protein [Ramlibacter alkalitolerans]|nr:hypothetical protein [Ramlibacter alkalitolerans]
MPARARRIAGYALAVVVLVGVFTLYTRPEMMVSIGDMIWACFR